MPWQRRYFKDGKQKVWIEVDDAGEPLLNARKLAAMRYKLEDEDRTYSANPRHIGAPVDPTLPLSDAPVTTAAAAPAAPAAPPQQPLPELEGDDALERVTSTACPDALLTLAPPAEGVVEIYTDGACQGNPGPCSCGVVIRFEQHYKEISLYLGEGTNNIGELTAILVGLQSLKRRDLPVKLHTDSAYSIGVLTQNWKAKANKELIATTRALLASFVDVELIKVKGHAGIPLNERVDWLAVEAIERQRRAGKLPASH